MLAVLVLLQLLPTDTVRIRPAEQAPALEYMDTVHLGAPQVRIRTRQGTVLVWLLRSRDTVFIAASIPDSSHYWGDDFVVSIDTEGNGGSSPGHDDFQLYFRRVLDSSVVYRGRNGKWQPPQADPDWRLRAGRSGGGWEVASQESRGEWRLLLRMDPAWFKADGRNPPRLALRIYDDDPNGWFAWPAPEGPSPAIAVEQDPSEWVPVQ